MMVRSSRYGSLAVHLGSVHAIWKGFCIFLFLVYGSSVFKNQITRKEKHLAKPKNKVGLFFIFMFYDVDVVIIL